MDNASYAYTVISSDDAFFAPVAPALSSVVFALKGGDELNKRVRRALLREGIVIGQTVMNGSVMLKLTLLNPNIGHEDLDRLIEKIKNYR